MRKAQGASSAWGLRGLVPFVGPFWGVMTYSSGMRQAPYRGLLMVLLGTWLQWDDWWTYTAPLLPIAVTLRIPVLWRDHDSWPYSPGHQPSAFVVVVSSRPHSSHWTHHWSCCSSRIEAR